MAGQAINWETLWALMCQVCAWAVNTSLCLFKVNEAIICRTMRWRGNLNFQRRSSMCQPIWWCTIYQASKLCLTSVRPQSTQRSHLVVSSISSMWTKPTCFYSLLSNTLLTHLAIQWKTSKISSSRTTHMANSISCLNNSNIHRLDLIWRTMVKCKKQSSHF